MRHHTWNLRLGLAPAALAAFLVLSSPARAGLILTLESGITASAGSTGNAFDVLLTNTGPSDVVVGSFSFGIVAADPAINFTQANISTTVDAYIFSGNSLFGPVISTLTGQKLEASDLPVSGPGGSLTAGSTLGVGHILFDVASGTTPGPIGVTFENGPTSLFDSNSNPLAFTAAAGSITITSTTAVPEPAPGGLLLGALAGFAILIQRLRT